jgi:hypothetical protein
MNGFRWTILVAAVLVPGSIAIGDDWTPLGFVIAYLCAAVCFLVIIIRGIWRLALCVHAPHDRTLLIDWCWWLALALPLAWVLLTVGIPGPWAREAAKRLQCNNNLKSIGLAIHNYAQKYGRLPPAYTVDKQGRRMHSWRVLLLEFSDPDLYAQYDLSRPWNSAVNLAFAKKMKKDGPYRCPTETPEDPLWTSYVMLGGPTAFSDGPNGRKFEELTDGVSNTVAVVEMSPSGILWTAPYDLNVAEMSFKVNDPDHACPRSCHSHGANILLSDGSVVYFGTGSNPLNADKHLKALTTINGGEGMTKFDNY